MEEETKPAIPHRASILWKVNQLSTLHHEWVAHSADLAVSGSLGASQQVSYILSTSG